MRDVSRFLIVCALAAAAPLWPSRTAPESAGFPGWPAAVEGRALRPQPLEAREQKFAEGFPGRIATFSDGRRRILLRWVVSPTRMLHPAADCLRGAGYEIEPRALFVDAERRAWGTTEASLGNVRWMVHERIVDAHGDSFTDASSWYWSALLGRSEGPWWAWTVFETEGGGPP